MAEEAEPIETVVQSPAGPDGDNSDVNWIEFAGRKRHPSNEYTWPQEEEVHLFAKARTKKPAKDASPEADERDVEDRQPGPKPESAKDPDEVIIPIVTKAISAPEADKADLDDQRARLIMAGLEKQYLKADDKYHFRNDAREVAFEAQDGKLVTQREDPAVIASMIDLAEARGWSSLKLNGSQDFRKEAWLQASIRGMEVSGYQPDKVDLARLDELKAEKAGRPSVKRDNVIADEGLPSAAAKERAGFQDVEQATEPKLSLSKAQEQVFAVLAKIMVERGDSPEAITMASEMAAEKLRSDRVHVGRLVETGTAPYNNVPGEKQSHFIVLSDEKGARETIWGVDLPRALEASGAKVGDQLALAFSGRQDVTIQTPITDAAGKVTGHESKVVNRNAWEIVQFDRLRDEGKAKLLEAAQRMDKPSTIQVVDKGAPTKKVAPTVTREREPSR